MVLRIAVNTLALLAVFFLVWNVSGDNVIVTAILMAVVLAVVNAYIRPVVLLLTLPASILTLGCFAVFINALFFFLAAKLVHIQVGFWRAFLGYIIFVIISGALNRLAPKRLAPGRR